MVSDVHSCSCYHKLDSIANEDLIQCHSLGNGCLSVWSVECSSKVAEAPLVVVAEVVYFDGFAFFVFCLGVLDVGVVEVFVV